MEQKNLLIAAVLSIAILLVWQFVYEQPRMDQARHAAEQKKAGQAATGKAPAAPSTAATVPQVSGTNTTAPPAPGAGSGTVQAPTAPVVGTPELSPTQQRDAVLQKASRLKLVSPRLHGSVRLKGGQFDDLTLTNYRETLAPDSPQITLLSPSKAPKAYFAQFGWVGADQAVALPDENTVWTADRTELSPGQPVTLRWDNGKGVIFYRTLSVDENYMFTVTQRVDNNTGKPVTLYPYGLISRSGTPKTLGFYILHEGLLGVFDGQLKEEKYDDLQETGKVEYKSKGGWLGITDKYWLVALVPDQKEQLSTAFRHTLEGKTDKYQADYLGAAQIVQPNGSVSVTDRLFAGAKEVRLLDNYSENLGIARFDLAVDFGWFYFLTKPIFYTLEYFYGILGNFGLAILLLTILIKLAFFPLANKSYKAMSRLKQLQPKMVALRERYGDDKAKQNEAMMRLYKEEKVNPAAGCLPMVIQIPVFFSLYKVLFVTIEMRQTPFYGWIQDLSARDPTTVFNLFGLIPWTPPDILSIGVWPLIMGLTMWLQQKLNPAPADPVQAKIFMFLPIVFTFMLARFPAGLVIYWAWNNVLSITQQWVIMRRMGVTSSGQTTKRPQKPGKGKPGGKPKMMRNAKGKTD